MILPHCKLGFLQNNRAGLKAAILEAGQMESRACLTPALWKWNCTHDSQNEQKLELLSEAIFLNLCRLSLYPMSQHQIPIITRPLPALWLCAWSVSPEEAKQAHSLSWGNLSSVKIWEWPKSVHRHFCLSQTLVFNTHLDTVQYIPGHWWISNEFV